MTTSEEKALPLVPENGFSPGDFPQLSVAQIPYTTNTLIRPDPMCTIGTDGWLFIEAGTVRVALPNRQEWGKLVWLVEALWNSHELSQQEENNNDDNQTDESGQSGVILPSVDQQRPRGKVASPSAADAPGSVSEPTDSLNGIRD